MNSEGKKYSDNIVISERNILHNLYFFPRKIGAIERFLEPIYDENLRGKNLFSEGIITHYISLFRSFLRGIKLVAILF